MRSEDGATWVALGRVKGPSGVRGDLRVIPLAPDVVRLLPSRDPPFRFPEARLLEFPVWRLGREPPGEREVRWTEGRLSGGGILVRVPEIPLREDLQILAGMRIWFSDALLPELPEGSFYWFRLLGLRVLDVTDPGSVAELGEVREVLATGSNDVLVVATADSSERLLPFIHETVEQVDPLQGIIRVRLMPGL
ncbi:MAG: 16S rRNA processing protein RimM [Magnetococcales bacterium]|nr:16S rRNA processing protein RimM [Magnetococcales bacterium]